MTQDERRDLRRSSRVRRLRDEFLNRDAERADRPQDEVQADDEPCLDRHRCRESRKRDIPPHQQALEPMSQQR